MLFSYLAHRQACHVKQREREHRIEKLDPIYHGPLSVHDTQLLGLSVVNAVAEVHSGQISPSDLLLAYSKKALIAHKETNCLTEIMISAAEAWARECPRQGPLAGMPVSLKDTVGVDGWDSCIGYSAWVNKPMQSDSALIRLLRDAGAVPFVKTNIPITLLSFESASDVFGRTTNPHNRSMGAGGSSGGEGALLAFGGSRIGIGTDVAGSVRCPAHYCGIYTIKASLHRFLKMGNATSMPGQEGIPAVYSPMTRTLEDLEVFWKAIFTMKPWTYDHSCLPIPWRNVNLLHKKLKWGILWQDGVVTPSPACERALRLVASTLEKYGHQVVNLNPPSPYDGLKIGSQLLLADGGKTANKPIRTGESNDPGMRQAMLMLSLPRWTKRIYAWYLRYIRKDEIFAGLVENWHEKSVEEYWKLIAEREDYRAHWFAMWQDEQLDFVLTVPNPLPALPHGGAKQSWKACGYTFLFNLLDYSAGVLPITRVDRSQDALSPFFKARNAIEAGMYKMYDAHSMHGLPIGVQVVGQRLEEEKVLEGMKIIESLLAVEGKAYESLDA